MKKTWLIFLMALTCLALIGLVGCSDDNDSDGPTGGIPNGDLDDPGFEFVEDALGGDSFEEFEVGIDLSLALLDSLPSAPAAARPNSPFANLAAASNEDIIIESISSYSYTNGWHIFSFEAVSVSDNDTTDIAGVDSVQVSYLNSPLDWSNPDAYFDAIKVRVHVQASERNGDAEIGVHHRMNAGLSVVGTDTLATFDGTVLDTIAGLHQDDSSTCEIEITQSQTIDSVVVLASDDSTEVCPRSGHIAVTATIDLSCTGNGGLASLNIEGGWTITATANGDGTVTMTYSDGTTLWSFTDNCGGGGA